MGERRGGGGVEEEDVSPINPLCIHVYQNSGSALSRVDDDDDDSEDNNNDGDRRSQLFGTVMHGGIK